MTIPRYPILFPVLGIFASVLASPASAQAQCGPREQVVKSLGERYKEAPSGMGVTQPGQVIELFTSDSGSWTMLLTTANGTSCLIAAGESWDTITRAKGTAT